MIAADPVRPGPGAPGLVPAPIAPVSLGTSAMGGRLLIHLSGGARATTIDDERARRDARRVLGRVTRWAARLSRHVETSELSALNADPQPGVIVGPTLGAALWAGREAGDASGGLVDITLLDARLAAEGVLAAVPAAAADRTWSLLLGPGRPALVRRRPGLRFDLGGVAKGWLADRALNLLAGWPNAVVDADGDLAVRCAPGQFWAIRVDDPRADDATLAILHLSAPQSGLPGRCGVATSGTSVHRWRRDGATRHHLIDPRTGAPAVTDVIQATVVCGSALRAESLARAAIIAGSAEGPALLERSSVIGAIFLTDRGETLALPSTLALLDAPQGLAWVPSDRDD